MRSLADGLPAAITHLIHPDWRKSEKDYRAVRDTLLSRDVGQWVGFADEALLDSLGRPDRRSVVAE
jgi:hypothetical protein